MDDQRELSGQTLLVIGAGAIGAPLGRRAGALGMQVLGVRRSGGDGTEGFPVFKPSKLRDLLPSADFVVLILPGTAETNRIIGEAEIGIMKRSTILINVGRGNAVDQTALTQALSAGRIGGAALDVFEQEPLPADSPLWEMENVVITAHNAGFINTYWDRAWEVFANNLSRFREGLELQNLVDRQRGY
jgi:phosphoglycerate dehydrogenase-like enzyme